MSRPRRENFLHFFLMYAKFRHFHQREPNRPKKTKLKILNQTTQEKTKKEQKKNKPKKETKRFLKKKNKFEEFGLEKKTNWQPRLFSMFQLSHLEKFENTNTLFSFCLKFIGD